MDRVSLCGQEAFLRSTSNEDLPEANHPRDTVAFLVSHAVTRLTLGLNAYQRPLIHPEGDSPIQQGAYGRLLH